MIINFVIILIMNIDNNGLRKTTMTINTLRTRDADLRFYITTVQDG